MPLVLRSPNPTRMSHNIVVVSISKLALFFLAPALAFAADSWTDRAIAEWVVRLGGSVGINLTANQINDLAALPTSPFVIRSLDFTGTLVEPEQLERIAGLTQLEELLLPAYMWNEGAGSRRDSNELFKYLNGLKKLKRLHTSIHFLTNMTVLDSGLDQISGLTQLEELRLSQSKVKGLGLKHFVNLRSLDLRYSAVNDKGMESLKFLTKLERLILRDNNISDKGIANIAGLTNLRELDLYGLPLTDNGVQQLAGLKDLRNLNLLGAQLTDSSVDIIASMPHLVELNLYRSQITNAGLTRLATLRNLEFLDVRYTKVTPAGVRQLMASHAALRVNYLDSGEGPSRKIPALNPSSTALVSDWVKSLGGSLKIENGKVKEINLRRAQINDEAVRPLGKLDALEKLDLSATEITDQSVAMLLRLKNLRELNLRHTSISDSGLAQLPALNRLQKLDISNTGITGRGFETWKESQLRELDASNCPLENRHAPNLAQLTKLTNIHLAYTDLTDPAMDSIAKLDALELLDLAGDDIGDAGIKQIAKIARLKTLLLNYAKFSADGAAPLAGLLQLQRLDLVRTRINDQSLALLAKLPQLQRINLDYTKIGDNGVASLGAAQALTELRLDSANVSDDAIPALGQMKDLKKLNLYHTTVTLKGFDQLKTKLPGCDIIFDRDSSRVTRRGS